jgi:hypothetical protein
MTAAVCVLIIIVLIGLFILYSAKKEEYCNCVGTKTVTNKPTYFVYRPTGDVSDYSNPCSNNKYGLTSDIPEAVPPMTNNSWKQTLGPNCTDSWAAGSGCNSSNVPLLSMAPPPENCPSEYSAVVLKSNSSSVPYTQNYGTPTCNLQTTTSPCCATSKCGPSVGAAIL